MLIPYNPLQIDLIWPKIIHFIEKGLNKSGLDEKFSPDDIKECIKNGELTLWCILHKSEIVGCCLTQFLCYPKSKILNIWLVISENIDYVIANIDDMCEYAKLENCDKLELFGRSGWSYALKPLGFRDSGIVMEYEV